eukprot:TRINITY_DN19337_c0_g1_i1.p1 TRINITY_DN19337_c0_g1~~TRINITY_DN19337_c0_g1_i1.p1  ORF type:complete len:1019 (+),score=401.02 TRINITY_DN19337_c0_g1_i1:75-3131(+)
MSDEAVRVVVRCRPFIARQVRAREVSAVSISGEQTVVLTDPDQKNCDAEKYPFDIAFPMDANQQMIYDGTASPLVEAALEGYNGTMFAYGQTGSGKTFTMDGSTENPGVMRQAFIELFDRVESEMRASTDHTSVSFLVQAHYVQIYNEEVYDLLVPPTREGKKYLPTKLRIRQHQDYGFYIEGVSKRRITCAQEACQVLEDGTSARVTAATGMNDTSSRSHAVLTLTVERRVYRNGNHDDPVFSGGQLNFVDLAGSESLDRAKTEGQQQAETKMINLSLTTLNIVIQRLTNHSGLPVPFRQSKLTMILKESLGGTARCVMMACISPSSTDIEETRGTLKHASHAKKIKNKPKRNIDVRDGELEALEAELAELRLRLEGQATETKTQFVSERMRELTRCILVPKSVQRAANKWVSATIGLGAKKKKNEELFAMAAEGEMARVRAEKDIKRTEAELRQQAEEARKLETRLKKAESDANLSQGAAQRELSALRRELEDAKSSKAEIESELAQLEEDNRSVDEARWDLSERVKQLEAELQSKNAQIDALQRAVQVEKEGKAAAEQRLREAERKNQTQLNESKAEIRQMESKLSEQRRQLEGFAAQQRGTLEQQQHEMRMELEAQLERVQGELRESVMREEQGSLRMVEVQEEMVKHKESAAGQAFSSKIHQVMARKHKDKQDSLNSTTNDLRLAADQQQGKYDSLSSMHEALLSEKSELSARIDELQGELREAKSAHRDVLSAEAGTRSQLGHTEEQLKGAKQRISKLEQDIAKLESGHRVLDEDGWKLKEQLRTVESELNVNKDALSRTEHELQREQQGKASLESQLQDSERQAQAAASDAKQQLRELESKMNNQRRELEGFAAQQRANLEQQHDQVQAALEGDVSDLRARLQHSEQHAEEVADTLTITQAELKEFKGAAAGHSFASKINKAMSLHHKQAGEHLEQQAASLGSTAEQQQQQFESLTQAHEQLAVQHQQVQESLVQSEAARKAMETAHENEMLQLKDILNGLLRCSNVLSRE